MSLPPLHAVFGGRRLGGVPDEGGGEVGLGEALFDFTSESCREPNVPSWGEAEARDQRLTGPCPRRGLSAAPQLPPPSGSFVAAHLMGGVFWCWWLTGARSWLVGEYLFTL